MAYVYGECLLIRIFPVWIGAELGSNTPPPGHMVNVVSVQGWRTLGFPRASAAPCRIVGPSPAAQLRACRHERIVDVPVRVSVRGCDRADTGTSLILRFQHRALLSAFCPRVFHRCPLAAQID